MPELLFLTQRIPYPPIKGEKIRPLQILRLLCERYVVHLGSLIDDPADWQHVPEIQKLCGETYFASLNPTVARATCLRGLLSGEPLSVLYFFNRGLSRWVEGVLARRHPEAAFVCSSAMAQYLLDRPNRPPRIVMDFADVDSDKWRQYAQRHRGPKRWIFRRESQLLLAFDRRIGRDFDASTFVSPAEASLFKKVAPEIADKTHFVNSGVDAAYFSPERGYETPYLGNHPVVVFIGTMNYWPNVDAASWFAAEMLPRLREAIPDLQFFIVGSHPNAQVRELASRPGVTVTGRVADVRPYLAHATAAVVPLRVAGGVQNKVLEAMAMAKPVVASSRALAGLVPEVAGCALAAEDPDGFVLAVHRVVEDGEAKSAALALRSRQAILRFYNWRRNLAAFLPLLGQRDEVPA